MNSFTKPVVRFSPLPEMFSDVEDVFAEMKELVASCDFTLGRVVDEFEEMYAEQAGTKYAIGVGSGTDALKIPLKAMGVGHGDEVITNANTFWATVGAIAEVGATPVFVDCDQTFGLDPDLVERAVTPRTKAIMPAHITGEAANIHKIKALADGLNLPVIEDACQALMAEVDGTLAGTIGLAAGYSMHPIKIINVWGDAGVIVTNDEKMRDQCRLLRNHGLANRDDMMILGYNSRLDSLQAVVGKWIVQKTDWIVKRRRENAARYDQGLQEIPGITLPPRPKNSLSSYLNYVVFAEKRDELLSYCHSVGIEAKVHYPNPVYRQPALAHLGHKKGDFPITDEHAEIMISFPVDQHIQADQVDYVIDKVINFYQ